MSKIDTLTDLANLQNETTAVNAINGNNTKIEAALENTLSRDGSAPNQMLASLDMNSNRIINLPQPVSETEPVRLIDVIGTTQDISAGFVSPSVPEGRLTLTSGTAIMVTSVVGATAHIYTPSIGITTPIYNGTNYTRRVFSEYSQLCTDTTLSPAACVPNANYDIYAWDDGVSIKFTRSDYWKRSAVTTMTIASPCVVTCAGSDFADGTPIVFTTSNTLPTGIVAGTTYFVKRTGPLYQPTSTFNIAATVGGAAINTSGSQLGTHTSTAGDDFGAIALITGGNCERQLVDAFLLNKNAITNGPAALRGTYVGTIRTNSTGTIDWQFGGVGAGGIPAILGVWNCYNRTTVDVFVGDTVSASSTTAVASWRNMKNIQTNWVRAVRGLNIDPIEADYQIYGLSGNAPNPIACGIAINVIGTFQGTTGYNFVASNVFMQATYKGGMGQGWCSVVPIEYNSTAVAGFWNNIQTGYNQTGLSVSLRM